MFTEDSLPFHCNPTKYEGREGPMIVQYFQCNIAIFALVTIEENGKSGRKKTQQDLLI